MLGLLCGQTDYPMGMIVTFSGYNMPVDVCSVFCKDNQSVRWESLLQFTL